MKYRELIDLIRQNGWRLDHVRGSHMIFSHPEHQGIVVVPGGGKLNRDAAPGTVNSVLKQARIKD